MADAMRLDDNGNPDPLRTRKAQGRLAKAVPGSPARLDDPPLEGRVSVLVQNVGGVDLDFVFSDTAPASAPGILTPGDVQPALAGADVGVYGRTAANSCPVFIQEFGRGA